MTKSLIKIISILLIVGLNWTGLSAISGTMAYFNDEEAYQSNAIVAATLDFHLESTSDFSPEVNEGQDTQRYIDLINDGTLGFKYNVHVANFSGDTNLCNALNLTANLDGGDAEYSGALTAFSYDAPEYSHPENWQFTAGLPTEASKDLENKTCNFKFIFTAEQVGDECYGFNDIEEISNVITTGQWVPELPELVINKVYYETGSRHGFDPDNEWVELYNNTNTGIDIMNWTIVNAYSSDVLSTSSLIIPSHGYAVITSNDTTWDSTWNYWHIPADVVKIVLADGAIGNGLSNTADMLALKNENGDIVDQMNWGTPDPSWPNYNDNLWNPGCPDIAKGHILARVPTGYDTDQPSDFKDLTIPYLTITYYLDTWYCGHTYPIYWTATNYNGPDSDLKIDIFYITDTDNSGTITPSDTTYLAANHIDNSGSYDFYVDPCLNYCYYGYVWFRIVAYGPENFMVQNYVIGRRVFEPPAPEDLVEEMLEAGCSCQIEPEILEPETADDEAIAEEEVPNEFGIDEPVIEEESMSEEEIVTEEGTEITEETADDEGIAEEEVLNKSGIDEAVAEEVPNESEIDEDVIIEEIEDPAELEQFSVSEDSPTIDENVQQELNTEEILNEETTEETYE